MTINPDGTKNVSYTYNGMTTTKTIDENGRVLAENTVPYAKESYLTDEGVTVTKESPLSVTIKEPVKRVTTYTFKDGQEYTGYETDWREAAEKTGNTSGLSSAISYPDYVDKNESWRYLNEMADTYGVDITRPVGSEQVYTKEEGVDMIPDYKAPFGRPSYTASSDDSGTVIKGGLASGDISYAGGYKGFDYGSYFDNARDNAYKKHEANKKDADMYYDSLKKDEADQYERKQKEAYLSNYFANKKAQEALLENGIKGGLAQSSIIKGQAGFENRYNDNLSEHMDNLNDIEAQRAKAYADIEARLDEYFSQIDLKEAEMAQEETRNYNEYALKAYLAQIDREEAEREREFKAQQAREEREHEMEMKGI